MSICENCGSTHEGGYGSGRFCSSFCSRSFSTKNKRKEINAKLSKRMKEKVLDGSFVVPSYTKEQIENTVKKIKETWNRKLLESDYSSLTFDRLRKRVVLEQNYTCNHCKLTQWRGKPIPLEVDHKDGNNQNNERGNLEAICPNCHALTPTWRGRNISHKKPKVTDLQVIECFLETGNIRKCLIKLGLAPKGGNYGRVKRALTQNGIPYK